MRTVMHMGKMDPSFKCVERKVLIPTPVLYPPLVNNIIQRTQAEGLGRNAGPNVEDSAIGIAPGIDPDGDVSGLIPVNTEFRGDLVSGNKIVNAIKVQGLANLPRHILRPNVKCAVSVT